MKDIFLRFLFWLIKEFSKLSTKQKEKVKKRFELFKLQINLKLFYPIAFLLVTLLTSVLSVLAGFQKFIETSNEYLSGGIILLFFICSKGYMFFNTKFAVQAF